MRPTPPTAIQVLHHHLLLHPHLVVTQPFPAPTTAVAMRDNAGVILAAQTLVIVVPTTKLSA